MLKLDLHAAGVAATTQVVQSAVIPPEHIDGLQTLVISFVTGVAFPLIQQGIKDLFKKWKERREQKQLEGGHG